MPTDGEVESREKQGENERKSREMLYNLKWENNCGKSWKRNQKLWNYRKII